MDRSILVSLHVVCYNWPMRLHQCTICHQIGHNARAHDVTLDQAIIDRYVEGETLQSLADELDTSSGVLRKRLRLCGVDVRSSAETRSRKDRASKRQLSWAQVDQLRIRHVGGESQKELAHEFGISYGTLGRILRGDSWCEEDREPDVICRTCGAICILWEERKTSLCDKCRLEKKKRRLTKTIMRESSDCCEICGAIEALRGQTQHHLDHNHTTGALRGVLCMRCNVCVGMSGENPEILIALASYLRERGFDATREIARVSTSSSTSLLP